MLRPHERRERGDARAEEVVRGDVVRGDRERLGVQLRHEVLLQAFAGGVELFLRRASPRGVAAKRALGLAKELLDARAVRVGIARDRGVVEGRDEALGSRGAAASAAGESGGRTTREKGSDRTRGRARSAPRAP
jgi:hypothetical protein